MATKTRPKLLIIDDTPENLFVLASALESEFDLQLASSGMEGIRLTETSRPDLILLDVMMPEIDGFETFRRFKNNPDSADIPIIFVTAVSDLESEISGLALGATDYITKPIKVEQVKHRVRNILRLTQMEEALKSSEERLRLVMNATGEGVWDWNIKSGEVTHNMMWCRILGLDERHLHHPVDFLSEFIHPDDLASVQKKLHLALTAGDSYVSEHRMRHSNGSYVWVLDRGDVVKRNAQGEAERMLGAIKNIDERKRNEAEIRRLAFYDTLTGLPNRRLLTDRLHQSILKNQRNKSIGAVMFMDMDRFKQLNDQHGHAMGDSLLVAVGDRLQKCVREQDTVARLGGDEFIVMLEQISTSSEAALRGAQLVGKKILDALNQPYTLGDFVYNSTPSIGLTLFFGKEDTVDSILKRADSAMYKAKSAGRNTMCTFEEASPDDEEN